MDPLVRTILLISAVIFLAGGILGVAFAVSRKNAAETTKRYPDTFKVIFIVTEDTKSPVYLGVDNNGSLHRLESSIPVLARAIGTKNTTVAEPLSIAKMNALWDAVSDSGVLDTQARYNDYRTLGGQTLEVRIVLPGGTHTVTVRNRRIPAVEKFLTSANALLPDEADVVWP